MRAIREVIQSVSLFSAVDSSVRDWVSGKFSLQARGMGEIVFEEGEDADAFYMLLAGKARVVTRVDGREVSLRRLEPGDHFGELGLLEEKPRNATVRIAADSSLLVLGAEDFSELLRLAPELDAHFRQWAVRIRFENFLRTTTAFGSTIPSGSWPELLESLEVEQVDSGDPVRISGRDLHVVQDGEIDVFVTEEGERKWVTRVDPGGSIGEDRMHGVDCKLEYEARDDSVVVRLPFDLLDSLLKTSKGFASYVEGASSQWARLADIARREEAGTWSESESRDQPEDESGDEESVHALRGTIRSFPFVPQAEAADCGAAVLGMVLKFFGQSVSMSRIRLVANVKAQGDSLLPLGEAAERLGLHSRQIKATWKGLQEIDLPVVLHWSGNRYVVLYRVDGGRVWLADPTEGLIVRSREECERDWSGQLLLLEPTIELDRTRRSPWSHFFRYLRPHRGLMVQIGLAALFIQLMGLATPKFTEYIVDQVVVHEDVSLLWILLVGMIIVNVASQLFGALRTFISSHIGRKIGLVMMRNFYDHLLRLPLWFFHKHNKGELLKRFRDNTQIQGLVMGKLIGTILDVALVVIYLGMMVHYNGTLTLLSLAFVVPIALLSLIQAPILKRFNRRLFETEAIGQSIMIESIQGVETVKTLNMEEDRFRQWEQRFCRTMNTSYSLSKVNIAFSIGSGILNQAATLVLLWYGAGLVIDGELSLGALMAFQSLQGSVFGPIMGLVGLYGQIQEASVSLERLADVLETPPEEERDSIGTELDHVDGYLKFEGVSFRYGADSSSPWILRDLSFEVPAGQTLALVGRSGSGKTTLGRLLMRLYSPQEGRILLDGVDIEQIGIGSLRRQMGTILQETRLFNGTIRENIALGEVEVNEERLARASQLALVSEFVQKMPMGTESIVGERGMTCSGGQRQRIGIARALYPEPSILLLDEATSSLDSESEAQIQENLEDYLKDRTAIIIAHRMSTVRDADQILVLEGGRIAERGDHESLMALGGLYHQLCSQQIGV